MVSANGAAVWDWPAALDIMDIFIFFIFSRLAAASPGLGAARWPKREPVDAEHA
jgi:hypothetical protein